MNSVQLILIQIYLKWINIGYGESITPKATTASFGDYLLCLPYLARRAPPEIDLRLGMACRLIFIDMGYLHSADI